MRVDEVSKYRYFKEIPNTPTKTKDQSIAASKKY